MDTNIKLYEIHQHLPLVKYDLKLISKKSFKKIFQFKIKNNHLMFIFKMKL